jgi:hypothetical protein
MTRATKLWIPLGVAAVVAVTLTGSANGGSSRGSIRGVVVDALGAPLPGAAVFVLAEAETPKADQKVIREATTDDQGKFTAANIAPGAYRVKAQAEGFSPVELAAQVKPNKVTVFDSILLRRVSTLNDETLLNADSKFAVRRVRGTIFHFDEAGSGATKKATEAIALTDRTPELHAAVYAFGQTTSGAGLFQSAFVGSNFAVSEQIGKDLNITIGGQAGYGLGAPQSLRAITTAHANDQHRVTVALGYGRFTFSRRSGLPGVGQFSVSATDTWQVSGPVLVVYGVDFSRFSQERSSVSILPRVGVAIDAGARTRVFAALVPGSSTDTQTRFNLESGEIEFSEPRQVAYEGRVPVMEKSYRLQFGGEQVLSDRSSVEVMAFLDTVSGHGVGLLAVPNENPAAAALLGESQSGRTRGVRVVYHRRVNKVLDGSVGYAYGQGQRLDRRGLSDPANLFSNGSFQVLSAKMDANFVRSGTRISTVLRFAPSAAVFAIDPFQGQAAVYDPNVSVSLTQDLPAVGFIPGQWAAVVDLRNLFDQQGSISDERQELIASRYHRLVRIGLSLRF